MHFIFAALRIYPVVAICFGIVFFELTVFFYRKDRHPLRFASIFMVALLVITTICWFVYRGDLNSDRWVRQWFGIR